VPYEVAYDAGAAVVRVKVHGAASHEEHEAARAEAAQFCREKETRRVLVDLRDLTTDRNVSTMTCFEFGAGFVRVGMSAATRVALVRPVDTKAAADVMFTANVAVNRGGNLREFATVADAEEWLRT
jgi:hypothetical protein